MMSCKNRHFLPPSVITLTYCLDPRKEQKWRHPGLNLLRTFSIVDAYKYNYIYISETGSPCFNYKI